jgi:hypothetical protein
VVHALFSNDLEKCIGSSFVRIVESALEEGQEEDFAPSSSLLTPVLLTMLSYSSWLASKIEPRLTELYSLPLRDHVTGAGLNTTCRVRACFIHRLRSAELSSMSVGSISIIY